MKLKLLLVPVLLTSLAFASGQWKSEKVQTVKAVEKGGKLVKEYAAPNKKAKLVLRDYDEQGDFVWQRLYLVNGSKVILIDAYNEVSKVRWSKDSRAVQFRAVKATDYNEISHLDVKYTLGAKAVQYKVVKREKFDGGG